MKISDLSIPLYEAADLSNIIRTHEKEALIYAVKSMEDSDPYIEIAYENGYSNLDDYFEENSREDMEREVNNFYENRILTAAYNIRSKCRVIGNNLIIYRVIIVDENWNIETQPLGIYWSWDKKAAESHWGFKDNSSYEVLITGAVNVQEVDWVKTIAMNASMSYEEEREIRIFEGSYVRIIKVESKEGEQFNYKSTKLLNKTLRA